MRAGKVEEGWNNGGRHGELKRWKGTWMVVMMLLDRRLATTVLIELSLYPFMARGHIKGKNTLLATILSVISVVLLSCLCGYCYWWKKKKGHKMNERHGDIFNNSEIEDNGKDRLKKMMRDVDDAVMQMTMLSLLSLLIAARQLQRSEWWKQIRVKEKGEELEERGEKRLGITLTGQLVALNQIFFEKFRP
ncbi:hypothetical protein MRB53_021478 [Persea americana]|uniref:Uncharacterized protein n=1 Tax=Persea americana TaxID=3435 RepID=A0ACC2L448_PERAE|nr:hypothetical protein MRB53_021478 [Persea americana]